MSVKIEVAKRKFCISQNEIEDVVWNLLDRGNVQKGATLIFPSKHPELSKFNEELHSITFNDVPVRFSLKFLIEFESSKAIY